MTKLALALAFAMGVLTVGAAAQSAEQDVRTAIQEMNVAGRNHDTKAYARYLADDLVWIGTDGTVQTKQQRLAGVPTGNVPTLSDITVRVHGDVALVTLLQTSSTGIRSRNARTMMKRDGRWQLVLYAAVPMARAFSISM